MGLVEIFYRHFVTCWIIDFTYWCIIGLIWFILTIIPMMLVRHILEIQEDD